MSLGEHFREFRRRALVCAFAILVLGIVGWFLYPTVIRWLQEPLWAVAAERHVSRDKVQLNYGGTSIAEAFSVKLKVSLWIGLILSAPIWLWQIWAFLAPGLTKKEKRIARMFIGAAVPLFVLGCFVASLVMKNAVKFLLGVTPEDAVNYTNAGAYINFVTKFILVFGLAFLLPVFLVGLNSLRILPGRVMVKGWRVAVMIIAVFSAVMSPSPDAWSMLALMCPLIGLFFAAVLLSMFLDRRRAGREEKNRAEWLDIPDDQKSAL
ncbi:twin-arginine translocase subunit TatC [Flexivirga sp. ID2601S]|uniref:Sec-independent protein translocase protein TatC n=2 Tax=Flexivirga aerilata TaxID=1656889 RepID=A0A849ANJ7_9MICO|nr:twin-arginine translocase subunit TatC [Flexivirga aerilata]